MTKIVSSSIIVVALLFAGCGKKEHKEAAAEASEHVEKAVDSAKEKADEVISEAKEATKEKVAEVASEVKQEVKKEEVQEEDKKADTDKSEHVSPEEQEMKPLKLAGDEANGEEKKEEASAVKEKESAEPAKEETKKVAKEESAEAPKATVTEEEIKVQEVKILNAADELKRATLYKEIMEMRAKLSAERKALAEKELEYVKLRNQAK